MTGQTERSPDKRLVLLVEDDADTAVVMSGMLEHMGFEVLTAQDGLQAVRMVESRIPDVVLMDIDMPNLDGHEAARRIRRQPWGGGDLAIIGVSGRGTDQDRERSKQAGLDHHLTKPLDVDALRKLLDDHFAGRKSAF